MSDERLTRAEKRIADLLARGFRVDLDPCSNEVALVPPGVADSWASSATVYVRRSTLENLNRKRVAVATERNTDD